MSKEDWNMVDSLPPEDRTYVRVSQAPGKQRDFVHALNPFSGVRVMLGSEEIDGAYLLEDTAPPAGFSEIRTLKGIRWMVRTTDIEEASGRPIFTPEDDSAFVERMLKALETPEAKDRIHDLVRGFVSKELRYTKLDVRKNQITKHWGT